MRPARAVEQDIGRLQVAVEDPALVGVVHRAGDDRQQLGRGPRVMGEPRQLAGEAAPLDQPHGEVVLTLVLADLIERHDVRDGRAGRRSRPRSRNRWTSAGVARWPARIILSATMRSSRTFRALKTTPMPPRAISSISS